MKSLRNKNELYSRAVQAVTHYSCKKCTFLALVNIVQRLVNFDGLERSKDFSLMLVYAKTKVFTTYQNLPDSVVAAVTFITAD
jgi:hypothetical protein